MKTVPINKVFVNFKCCNEDCEEQDSARVGFVFLAECGTPVCGCCDDDMWLVGDDAEIEE
jgi:hypothetical protein